MPSEALRILEALVKAKIALHESTNHDHRPHWVGVTCPSCGVDYRSVSAVDGETRLEERRLPPHKIHKAGSAESILRHCLRANGWTSAYKRGELTQAQHRDLLEAIRQYGRAWLRHESEQFVSVELGRTCLSEQGMVLGSGVKDLDVHRAFFHPEDKGFFANLGRFFRRTKQFIRELIVAGVQAILGPAPLTGEDLDAAEREAQRQEQFFDRFHDEIKQSGKPQPRPEPIPGMEEPLEPPGMTPGQFTARVEKYADSAWQAPQRINRDKATQQGIFKLERRILGVPKTEHCSDCPPLAELGWQPIGTLPAIGESECGPLCLCHFEYTEEEGKPPAFDGGMSREEYNAIIKRVEEYEPEFTATVVMGED